MSMYESTLTEIEDKIRLLRLHMIAAGMAKGLNHPETIKYSQDLDNFLNKYNSLIELENGINPISVLSN